MPRVSLPRRPHRLTSIVAIGVALALYAALVIRNFQGPIGDHVESFLYEYLSYYVSKNLSFHPLPHLNLENDQVFYPFGTNQALQSFCVERDLLFTLLARTFGRGPWLQLYYLGGLAVAAYGMWALLRKDHGDARAAVASIFANFLNFYGAQKYPYHFNMAVVHWTTLSIVCDFVVFERLVERRRVSISLLLLRVLLVILSFGLELGHVVGYGLTSLLFTGIAAVTLLVVRRRRGDDSAIRKLVEGARDEWRTGKAVVLLLGAAIAVFGVLYGSIVGQIVLASRKYDFRGVPLGVWWSHPIRLLIPYFPWIHPSQQPRFLRIFGDQAEVGIGSGGAGLFLLSVALVAVVQSYRHKRLLRYAPVLAMFVAYVVSRPTFDLVRWMPWFAFTRVLSRATVVYSALLALLALDLSLDFPRRIRVAGLAMVGVVAGLELVTFATIKLGHPAFAFDAAFFEHMKRIEELPGEAVLDFPFCILGGNGDLAGLCPYMERLKSVYALQRFHHKKVIGQYLGRVHPRQTQPFVDQGWPKMWDPDEADPIVADKQVRCLTDAEWTFFSDFFMTNDFAGIQLAVDRLPPGCAEEFYARFGRPMGEVTIPKAGRLAFIPRDPSTRNQVDREAGKHVRLSLELTSSIELIRKRRPVMVDVTGLSDYEWLDDPKADPGHWRWGLAPRTEVKFQVSQPRELVAELRFRNPLSGQRIEIAVDGTPLETISGIEEGIVIERTLRARVGPGQHTFTLTYALANASSGSTAFAPQDPRAMTVMYESFHLHADPLTD